MKMNSIINDQSILITGGTGSFGKSFIKKILKDYNPKKIIVYSRDELKQFEMLNSKPFSESEAVLRYFIGDVRDLNRLIKAMEGIDVVIHAAALKHVPATEYNPFEAVKTNILGGQNVIDAALATNVKRVIALSTDKAAAPINLYGATKLASDKLFVAANNHKGAKNIRFSVVRYGNVFASRGSVIPFFLNKKQEGKIPITDARMTRFSITLDESVNFVLSSLSKMWGGEIFIPKIPSYNIMDLAKAICNECEVEVVGIRPGEKLHEEMITETDSLNTIEFQEYFVILPSMRLWDIEEFRLESDNKPGKFCDYGFKYNSGTNKEFLSIEQLRELISEIV